jgi:hypothetical protein
MDCKSVSLAFVFALSANFLPIPDLALWDSAGIGEKWVGNLTVNGFLLTPPRAIAQEMGQTVLEDFGQFQAGDNQLEDGRFYRSYQLQGPPGQTLSVLMETQSSTLQPEIQVFDPNDAVIAHSLSMYEGVAESQFTLSEEGVYTLVIYGQDVGAYRLVAVTGQEFPKSAIQEKIGSPVYAYIQVLDSPLADSVPYTFFEVNGVLNGAATDTFHVYQLEYLPMGQKIAILLESVDFDPYVQILNANGETVAENDDLAIERFNYQAGLTYTIPESGQYKILVGYYSRSLTGSNSGPYRLVVVNGSKIPELSSAALAIIQKQCSPADPQC